MEGCSKCKYLVGPSITCNAALFPDLICTACVKIGFEEDTLFRDRIPGLEFWKYMIGPYADAGTLPRTAMEKHEELLGIGRKAKNKLLYTSFDVSTPKCPLVVVNELGFGYVYKLKDIVKNVENEQRGVDL